MTSFSSRDSGTKIAETNQLKCEFVVGTGYELYCKVLKIRQKVLVKPQATGYTMNIYELNNYCLHFILNAFSYALEIKTISLTLMTSFAKLHL